MQVLRLVLETMRTAMRTAGSGSDTTQGQVEVFAIQAPGVLHRPRGVVSEAGLRIYVVYYMLEDSGRTVLSKPIYRETCNAPQRTACPQPGIASQRMGWAAVRASMPGPE